MTKLFTQTKTLDNGIAMPQLGLGVYKMTNPEETVENYLCNTGRIPSH